MVLFVPLVGLLLAHGTACSSGSSLDPVLPPPTDSGGGSDGGGMNDSSIAPYDAQGTPLVKCGTMTCARGDICVQNDVDGGTPVAPEAGQCPGSSVPDDAGNLCVTLPNYHCKGFPAACAGVLTCACAASLCEPSEMCQGGNGQILTCVP
jgi:hypothetical protein